MKERIERLKHLKNERGLTLVELLAVIVILAIVAIIAFVMIGNVMENARKDAHISNAQQLISAAKLYDAEGGQFSDGTTGTVGLKALQDAGLIGDLISPWGDEPANYGNNAIVNKSEDNNGKVTYKVTLNGKDASTNITEKSEAQLAKGRDTGGAFD